MEHLDRVLGPGKGGFLFLSNFLPTSETLRVVQTDIAFALDYFCACFSACLLSTAFASPMLPPATALTLLVRSEFWHACVCIFASFVVWLHPLDLGSGLFDSGGARSGSRFDLFMFGWTRWV